MGIDQTVSDFDQLQHHAETRFELNQLLQAKRIPNALLFTGLANSGRKAAAVWFAKGCNCSHPDRSVCGRCRSCLKIDADSHPDMHRIGIESGKKIITITQIRQLGLTLSSRPNEADYRMVLIQDAHQMNNQAQNGLLKMLEEPPLKTFFILIADKPSMLLPTIISRCRQFRFKQMSQVQIESLLCDTYNVEPMLARLASKTADKDLQRALMYLDLDSETGLTNFPAKRKWLISSLFDIIFSRAVLGKSMQKGLMVSRTLSLEPNFIDDYIAVMKTVFRDMIIFFYDPEKIVNLDFFDEFKDISGKLSKTTLFKWWGQLCETERKMAQNCSPRLVFDGFFLQLLKTQGSVTI